MILKVDDPSEFLNALNSVHDDMDGSFPPEAMDVLKGYEVTPPAKGVQDKSEWSGCCC